MKVPMIVLADLYDAPVDPASMQYKAVAARKLRSCSGCLFDGQRVKVCREACEIAKRAGLPDCDDIDPATGKTYVYQLRDTDPRQIDLVNGA
jgi:hypothetical protein